MRQLLYSLSKNVFFDRLAEVKEAVKTSKPHSSAYIGTVEGGLRSKSKCPATQAFSGVFDSYVYKLVIILKKNMPTIKTHILTVGGFFDTLGRSCLSE